MPKTVLLVDDSQATRTAISGILRVRGMEVLEAGDGALALSIAERAARLDYILVDLNMPVLGGIEFLRVARARPRLRALPIYVLTAQSGSELRGQAKSYGATGWIKKPVEASALLGLLGHTDV